MRPADRYHAVGESLQADVMRFMAIIAFCLIAILALVRSVEPAAPAATPAPLPAPPDDAPTPPDDPPAIAASMMPAEPGSNDRQNANPTPPPEAGTREEPKPTPAPPAEPRRPDSAPAATPSPPPRAVAKPRAGKVEQPAHTPASTEPVLTLRFASDQDFLRLVGRGRIQVYAFDGSQVLHLGEDFRFAPAGTPGRVHELQPDTIPALMLDALRAAGDTGAFHWGIAMPERMARQVRGYVDRGVSGELVIDRYGEVRLHDGV